MPAREVKGRSGSGAVEDLDGTPVGSVPDRVGRTDGKVKVAGAKADKSSVEDLAGMGLASSGGPMATGEVVEDLSGWKGTKSMRLKRLAYQLNGRMA